MSKKIERVFRERRLSAEEVARDREARRKVRAEFPPAKAKRPQTTKLLINQMVRRIVQLFRPDKVILFGSHARGEAGPDSDVDLLIVMPVDGNKREKRLEIRSSLGDFTVPLDVVVTTPEDFLWRKEIVGTIEWPAFREGKVLYARS